MNKLMLAILALGILPLYAQQEPAPTMGGLQVTEAMLGRSVENRQLVDTTSTFEVNDRVYLWLKVTGGAAGDSLTVTWKHGEHAYTTMLGVGGSTWRTWAYKTAWDAGDWTVTIADKDGNVLKDLSFRILIQSGK